jgi:hypothetical protein
MANDTNDLWSDEIGKIKLRTPVTLLKEQASLLGKKTGNLVEAEVRTSPMGVGLLQAFVIVVPALFGYSYTLFQILHGPTLYPATVYQGPAQGRQILNEDELVQYLREVLASPATTRLIAALMAQAQA